MKAAIATEQLTLDRFVEELRRTRSECKDERDMLSRVRRLAPRFALAEGWVQRKYYEADPEQGFGVHVLHEEPDHTLAVFAVSWLPSRGTPAHDHGTWAVIVGVDGAEKNVFWERADDRTRPGYAELRKIGEKLADRGDVVAMPAGAIHSVHNESERVTLSLHVYGKHVNHTERSQFDPARRTETAFKIRLA
ncbi:MAG TPA: cysteine dioxygenase family protein [Burkholderiales bacterium]|nr:cysteine dioxygenase family protein [Burkholderiales bacterium]